MAYLHSAKIVHRDLALRNLLVAIGKNHSVNVKISDFGMSKVIDGEYYLMEARVFPVRKLFL
jgi:serine/threonine protein kinase